MSRSKGVHRWVRSGFVAGGLLLAPAVELGFGENRHDVAARSGGVAIQAQLGGAQVLDVYRPMCGFCVEI